MSNPDTSDPVPSSPVTSTGPSAAASGPSSPPGANRPDAPIEGFVLTSSPHTFAPVSTRRIMYLVIVTLLPAVVISVLYFGLSVLLLYAVGVVVSVATEAVTKIARKRSWKSALDGSAMITGLLLVMTLPPSISPIAVAVGALVAIFIGKEVFGGLGANVFNPALVGRAFLAAAYPVAMTSWTGPAAVFRFLPRAVDATTSATPLAASKFDHATTPALSLFFGQTGGSIGETSALFIMVGGLVLLFVGIVRWPVVVSLLGTVFLLGEAFHLGNPAAYPSGLFQLLSGGLALGAFYMATDLVTTPYTDGGGVIFGVGTGILVIIIRLFGGYPEGVMYAILLMNAATPLINRSMNGRVFGRPTHSRKRRLEGAKAEARP